MAKLVILFSMLVLVALAAAGDDASTTPADATTTLAPGNETDRAAPAAPADAALAPDANAAPAAPADAALAPGDDADTTNKPKVANQGSR